MVPGVRPRNPHGSVACLPCDPKLPPGSLVPARYEISCAQGLQASGANVIRLKEGVSLRKLQPQAVFMAVVMDQVYTANGIKDCVITSGDEGKHKANSLHYVGKALDFRSREMTAVKQIKVISEARAALGRDFDVVLEPDHIHCEWDAK